MSTIDEAALTTDGLGCVGPVGTPGSHPLAESNPVSATAAANDVEICLGYQSRDSGVAEAGIAGGEAHIVCRAQDTPNKQ